MSQQWVDLTTALALVALFYLPIFIIPIVNMLHKRMGRPQLEPTEKVESQNAGGQS